VGDNPTPYKVMVVILLTARSHVSIAVPVVNLEPFYG
jgi:hypothetical protein